jgi:hypothetical protein
LVTVTVPVVLAPIALNTVAAIDDESASLIVTFAVPATTKVFVVTKAAVTCAAVPVIVTALLQLLFLLLLRQ